MNAQVIAIRDDMAASAEVGSIVWWSLRGDVNRDQLQAALRLAGSSVDAPPEVSQVVALSRAMAAAAKLFSAETHQRKRGSWLLVHHPIEDGLAKRLTYDVRAEAELRSGVLEIAAAYPDETTVREAYAAARANLSVIDMGGWYCDQLTRLGAIPLRERGGFYFLPRAGQVEWERIVSAVHSSSEHRIERMPAMRSADAVDAIIRALTADTAGECTKLQEALDNGVGSRALAARERDAANLLVKVASYEAMLGASLDTLRNSVEEMRGAVCVARLSADAAAAASR